MPKKRPKRTIAVELHSLSDEELLRQVWQELDGPPPKWVVASSIWFASAARELASRLERAVRGEKTE